MVLNKKNSVLQVLPDLNSGGVERGTIEVNKYIVNKGYRSIVISNGGRLVEQVLKDKGEHYKLPIGKKNLLTFFTIFQLIKFIRINEIDIVHARSRLPAWICFIALKLIKKNKRPIFITTFHGAYSANFYSSIMAKGDKVIVISKAIEQYVLKNYKVENKKIILNYRGVSEKEFSPKYQVTKDWLKNWYQEFPALRSKILFSLPARITRIKGQDHFIKIIESVVKKNPNIHGLIVGDKKNKDSYMNELKAQVKNAGLCEKITFVGYRHDIKQIMSISRLIFSLTKIPEAFGRVTLESLSLGVPVIAYSHGGVKEQLSKLLPEGLIEIGNIDDAVKLAIKWINEPPVIKNNNFFTLEKMLKNTLEIYKQSIEEKGNNLFEKK